MVDIQEAAEEQKMQITEALEEAKTKMDHFEKMMAQETEQLKKSKEEIQAARSKVRTTIEELIRGLKEHETEMIAKLDDVDNERQRCHTVQQERVQLLAAQLRSSVEYCEAVLQRNLNFEILETQQTFVNRCKSLLNEEVNISEPSRVNYETNERAIQTMLHSVPGQVVVVEAEDDRESNFTVAIKHSEEKPCFKENDRFSYQYKFLSSFGARGEGRGAFCDPWDIAVDFSRRNIAVADTSNNRIQIFSSDGHFLREFGRMGNGGEILEEPGSLAFTKSGNLIVIDSTHVSLFTEDGLFIKHIRKHLINPWSVSVGTDDHIIVCDKGDKSVKVLSPDGTELLQSFSTPDCDASPWFAVYHQDMFFVSYGRAHCVKAFTMEGVFLYDIGSEGSGDGQLSSPTGLAIDKFNNLIVCDSDNGRLQVFSLDGKFVNSVYAGMIDPIAVAVTGDGHMLVCDLEKSCIYIFQ